MTVRADGAPTGQSFRVCDVGPTLAFDGERAPAWSLSDDRGMHVIRTGVGFGEITVLEPPDVLSNAMLKRADHAEMFAAAAGLRHDDTLLIFHPATAEPLPALLVAARRSRQSCSCSPPCSPWPGAMRRASVRRCRCRRRCAALWPSRSAPTRASPGAHAASAGYGPRRGVPWMRRRPGTSRDMARSTPRRERSAWRHSPASMPAAIGAARAEGAARRLNEERAAITLMEVCRRILLRMHSDHQRPLA